MAEEGQGMAEVLTLQTGDTHSHTHSHLAAAIVVHQPFSQYFQLWRRLHATWLSTFAAPPRLTPQPPTVGSMLCLPARLPF